jgi:hypothetical protein
MLHICGVSKTFGEWYQKTNKTEDTNKLTLLGFKIIAILQNTRLATFIKVLETVSKGLFRNRSQNTCQTPYGGNPTTFNSLYILLFLCHFNSRTSWCYYVIQTVLFYTRCFTHCFLSVYILDKPPYRSVFSRNSDESRSSLKMADYCRNM